MQQPPLGVESQLQLLVHGSLLLPGHPSVTWPMLCPEDARLSLSLLLACTLLLVLVSVGVSATDLGFQTEVYFKIFWFSPLDIKSTQKIEFS